MEKFNFGKITREKVLIASTVLASFLGGCHGPEATSRDTLKRYFESHANAEKVDPVVLSGVKNSVEPLKLKSNGKEIYLVDDSNERVSVQAVDDSTLFINYKLNKVNSGLSERQKELTSYTSEEVTFKKDGIVSIKLGDDRLTSSEMTDNVRDLATRMVMEIDEETGGIVNYGEDVSQYSNSYWTMKINKDGVKEEGGPANIEKLPTAKEEVSKRMHLLKDKIDDYLVK